MKVIIDIDEEVLKHPHNYCCYAVANQIKGNYIPIPDNATNGDVIKLMFPSDAKELDMSKSHLMYYGLDYIKEFRKEWWNAPYKKEVEE